MKKDNRSIKWLYDELPELISEDIISKECAEKLKNRYGQTKSVDSVKVALTIFGIIGSILIGGGIILILAHNWADMSRPVRAVLSFIPLIAAQIIAGYTLFKKDKSIAWKEGAGAFFMLALGSAIALIGQTYHVSGNLGSFLFTWMLLSLPVIYLLNCSTAGIFYLAGIISWMGYTVSSSENPLFFLLFFAMIIPHILISLFKNRYSFRSTILLWGTAIILPIATGMTIEYMDHSDFWYLGFVALWSIFYLIGSLWFDKPRFAWQKPFHTIGAFGIFIFTIIFTYDEVWRYTDLFSIFSTEAISSAFFHLSLIAVVIILMGIACFRKRFSLLLFGILPILTLISGLISDTSGESLYGIIIFNIYMAVLGIGTIILGIKENRLGKMNAGMLITSILILIRFFDSDASILLRGIAFIIIGIGFLTVNVLIVRRKKRTVKSTERHA